MSDLTDGLIAPFNTIGMSIADWQRLIADIDALRARVKELEEVIRHRALESLALDGQAQELQADNARLRAALGAAQVVVNRQAEDDGLWFNARTAPEAYLQQELRALHRVIEATRAEALK